VQLATAMQPATAFQDELAHLVRAFEPARRCSAASSSCHAPLAMPVRAISLAETTRPGRERASSVSGLWAKADTRDAVGLGLLLSEPSAGVKSEESPRQRQLLAALGLKRSGFG